MQSESVKDISWRNPKFILKLFGILLLGSIVLVSILRDKIVQNQSWQVSVVGQGKITYTPDTARLVIGVNIDKAENADVALQELNTRTDAILKAVKQTGVSEENIQTQGFYLTTHYDYIEGISSPSGYDASQQLIITMKEVKKDNDFITKVINSATKAGANRIEGLTFEVSNLEELKNEARLKAITDAKSRAVVLADLAGVRLKKIVSWQENVIQAPGPVPYYYADGKGGGGNMQGSVPTGVHEIIIEMNVSYLIK